jgi:hypothetical protein
LYSYIEVKRIWDMENEAVIEEALIGILALEKCTRQHARTAERNAKFHSSQAKDDQCIARIATRIIKNSKG